jgi:beta-glucosidase/6-phospho-beta-glucosidase/beta-galactosidase
LASEGATSLFRSFWMAGYESACHINSRGVRLDMLASVQHDQQADPDYVLLKSVGIATVRDGIRWHLIDQGGRLEFSSLAPLATAARRQGIQVIWTLCHYGWPDDVDVFSGAFVDRFARYAGGVARYLMDHGDGSPLHFTPINEISFLCWGIGHRIMHPFASGRDNELKRQFIRATIAACDAIREVDPRARFVQGEPVIHVVPPRDRPDLAAAALAQREAQFETWDMLCGRAASELGGGPGYLDIVAAHYYHSNQWEHPDRRLRWEDEPRDERWLPLHRLLGEIQARYGRPLVVGETSHFGVGRARWIAEIGDEVARAIEQGVPVEGVCLYPILDRHDWDNVEHWHNSGLWDLRLAADGRLERILNAEYAAAFQRVRGRFAELGRR